MTANEFRALLFVIIAEMARKCIIAGDLRRQMGLSGAAITYLVERMTDTGHLRRDADPSDRGKVILRHTGHGMDMARAFFTEDDEHNHRALQGLTDSDLEAAHRAFGALADGLHTLRTAV